MKFLKDFFINLVFLGLGFLVFYVVLPDIALAMFKFLFDIFGPWLFILWIIAAALPRVRRRR